MSLFLVYFEKQNSNVKDIEGELNEISKNLTTTPIKIVLNETHQEQEGVLIHDGISSDHILYKNIFLLKGKYSNKGIDTKKRDQMRIEFIHFLKNRLTKSRTPFFIFHFFKDEIKSFKVTDQRKNKINLTELINNFEIIEKDSLYQIFDESIKKP